MKRVLITITFTQQPSPPGGAWPARSAMLTFTFVHAFETESTWRNLADTGKITLPKNVYVADANNRPVSLMGTNVNIGGFSTNAPLFLKGDKVSIEWGYAYFDGRGNEVAPKFTIFAGYISKVGSGKPVEVEVMDNMYKLQQVQAPVKEWAGYTVEKMMQAMMANAGLGFTVNQTTQTSIGNLRTGNETIAAVLGRLRKDYNFDAYFRGNELRCGSVVYIESDANTDILLFQFQYNIIKDSLEYTRTDDVILSAVCHNTIDEATGATTKDGQQKTQKAKLEVLITIGTGGNITYTQKTDGQPLPDNIGGERREFFFPGATTIQYLQTEGLKQLKKYYYTGFKGKFTTFGTPYVKHGDNINISDPVLPERNGQYKVRGVKYSGGEGGLRQEIELDYKI